MSAERKCAGCKERLDYAGLTKIRHGGFTGLLAATLGDVGEEHLEVALYECMKCGRLEMFRPSSEP